jgi:curved DNA-binding protein CbpA
LKAIEEAMKIATACSIHYSTKVECLLRTKQFDEADKMICEKLNKFPNDAEAKFLNGLKFYLRFSVKKSIPYFEDSLIIEPNFKKCQEFYERAKKIVLLSEKGSRYLQTQKFDKTVKLFSELLTVDSNNHRLISNTLYHCGVSHFWLQNYKEAIDDFTEALKIDRSNLKALEMRAKAHLNAEEFADCVIDCEEYLKLQQSKEVENNLNSARTKLKSSKPIDYYKVLGVSRNASQDEIKQAYRKKTLELHTDKHPSATDIDKKKLEKKFNEAVAAYKYLTEKTEEKEKPKPTNFRCNQKQSESSNNQQSSSSSHSNSFNAGSSSSSYNQQQNSSSRDRFSTDKTPNFNERDQAFQSSASSRPFHFPYQFSQPVSQDFSTSSGGCNGMVREGNGFRPCKKTINCPHHRAANGKSATNSDSLSNLNFYINSSNFNACFGYGSSSSGFSSSSSRTSNRCTGMVMDRSTKTMRQCKNTRNCPHH